MNSTSSKSKLKYPLVDSSYNITEINKSIEVLKSGQLTMGAMVKKFEYLFTNYIDIPYSVMVNSGSSANLLAFSAITNPARKNHLCLGDKVAIPAVCWPTSLWPIIQTGLVPVLIDVDPNTLNLSLDSLRKAIVKEDIKALMMVHTLGNSTEIEGLLDIVNNNNIILIEDTCESLGTKYQDDFLGSIGDFGTFSFYFSHHMTTIEGGMIVCKNLDDYDLLKCLRTHGWSREQSNKEELERDNSNIDPRWLFINMGFNLRPMEIQAAFGIEQIKRLDVMNIHRKENVDRIQQTFIKNSRWEDQLAFPKPTKDLDPCWFGFPFLIRKKLIMEKLREALLFNGIENRPIISGNIAIQPAIKLFNVDLSMGPFVGAQEIHDRGLFVGCHSKLLDDDAIAHLVRIILDEIQKLS